VNHRVDPFFEIARALNQSCFLEIGIGDFQRRLGCDCHRENHPIAGEHEVPNTFAWFAQANYTYCLLAGFKFLCIVQIGCLA